MNNITKIGIIGLGFVGGAVKNAYDQQFPFVESLLLDNDPAKGHNATYAELMSTDAIFICVPSPQNADGSCNSDPLRIVMGHLKGYKNVIISKVTAPPNVYTALQVDFPNLVHAPEFLTAVNANSDYMNGEFAIVGGDVTAYINEAIRIIKMGQPYIKNVVTCSISEASLAKYTINCFLATKVIFMNEIAKLAEDGGQNWQKIRELISLDQSRMGTSHTQVPGPDNAYGFGGACFPKDTAALLKYAEYLGCQMNVLDAAVKKNLMLRLTDEPK
jgi:UDPglucose 6-dehydrogenase